MVKKVTGVSKILFFSAVLLISPIVSISQGLTEQELSKLLDYRSSIKRAIEKGDDDLAFYHLIEMNNYANTFTEIEKKDEAGALYCFEYLALLLQKSSNKIDPQTILKDIEVSESCLYGYNSIYRGSLSEKINARIDLVIIWGLIHHYKNLNNYQRALDYLEVYVSETMKFNPSKRTIAEINSTLGDLNESLGLYYNAIEFYNKSHHTLREVETPTFFDTIKIIRNLTKIVRIKHRQFLIPEAFNFFSELSDYNREDYYSFPSYSFAYLEAMEALVHIYTFYGFYDRAFTVLQQMNDIVKKGGLNELNCYSCVRLVNSSAISIFKGTYDWEKIYSIIKSDSLLFVIHFGDFLKATLALDKFSEAISTIDYINDYLKEKFQGLSNIDRATRAKKIQSWVSSGNFKSPVYTLNYLGNMEYRDKFLDYIIKYKSIETDLNSSYKELTALLDIKNVKDSIINCIRDEDIVLEIIKSSIDTEMRYFLGVQSGIELAKLKNGDIIVSRISPKSNAFYSGLRTGDVIASVDNKSINKMKPYEVVKKLNAGPIGTTKKIGIKRDGKDSILSYHYKIDSIYIYMDSIQNKYKSKYAIFTISNTKNAKYDYWLIDSKKIDSALNQPITKEDQIFLPAQLTNIFNSFNKRERIYLSTDGVFHKVNPEILVVKDKKATINYLGDLLEFRLINSSRELLKKESNFGNNSITLFGYPNFTLSPQEQLNLTKAKGIDTTLLSNYRSGEGVTGNYVFTPLPATKHEVEEIGAFMKEKGWDVEIYTGDNALEEQVKAVRSPRILHIATHGFFAEDLKPERQSTFMGMESKAALENPMLRSGLAFAGAERTRTDTTGVRLSGVEDGILTAEEVQYLNLDSTELVVLSACETGLGEIVNGEGVYGLQRAFRAAGARSVLMSLWKVDDLATETLMKNFYKHWLDEGMTKHDALWQAKLDLRNDKVHPEWAKPFFWGAFVLVGE